MLPKKPSVARRYVIVFGLIISLLFGQQSLTKILEVINAVTVEVMPRA